MNRKQYPIMIVVLVLTLTLSVGPAGAEGLRSSGQASTGLTLFDTAFTYQPTLTDRGSSTQGGLGNSAAAPTATIIVSSSLDTATAGDGVCTLREAIVNANNDSDATAGDCAAGSETDTIHFSIGAVGSTQTISLTSALPALTTPVFIDGWSQGGAGYTGPPLIELDGSGTSGFSRGLNITGGGSTVRGLVIHSFPCDGIRLYDGDGNWIYANYVGTDVGGTIAQPNNTVNGCGGGIVIRDNLTPSDNNIIGTNGDGVNDALEGNLISGNSSSGIQLDTDGNKIAGNLIGLDVTGTADLGNTSHGVIIQSGALTNTIGTDGDGVGDVEERNLISGNDSRGVYITDSGNNVIAGNYIGTDVSGTADLGNTFSGVYVGDSPSNRIGTDGNGVSDTLERNIVSGNGDNGVWLYDDDSEYNVVAGNYIGVDATGVTVLRNDGTGVRLDEADRNTIGTNGDGVSDSLEGNIISGNGDSVSAFNYNSGISIYSWAYGNVIAGNIIGSDASGTLDLGNYGYGVFLQQNSDGVIGTDGDGLADDAEGNLISGNRYGVYEASSGSTMHNYTIAGNLIGTQADGLSPLGNSLGGIYLQGADTFTIQENTIAHNGGDGIFLYDWTISNTISANSIFSNTDLGIDLQFPGGVTANDSGDGDTGANNLQNLPVIGLAESTLKGQTLITGTLNSTSNTTFTLEFFHNDAADSSGYGEGQVHLGSADVSTDGSGNVTFTLTLNRTLPPDKYVTATATDPGGNTSEFSAVYGPAQGLLDDAITGLTATCVPSSCQVYGGMPLELTAGITGGTGVMYAWDLGDAWAASGQVVPHTYATPGVYTATVTARNNNDSQSSSVVVTILDPTPVVDAGSDQTVPVGSPVTLDGSGSFDPDGNPLTYGWTQTDGESVTLSDSSAISPTFTAPATAGVLAFTLTVTDSFGLASAPDTVVITVTAAANHPPEADAGSDQTVMAGDLVTLDGSGSFDLDGDLPLTYGWQQTGGTLGLVTLSDPSVVTPTFTAPDVAGAFTFTLVVTDSLGLASAPDEVVVTLQSGNLIYLPLVVRTSG